MNTNVWQAFISLIFPNTCIPCAQPLAPSEQFICLHCLLSLPRVDRIESGESDLLNKFVLYPQVTLARSYLVFRPNSAVQQLVHAFKYKGNQELAGYLGGLIASENVSFFKQRKWDAIVPLPLHKTKKRQRGYNQSELLANGIGEVLDIPVWTDQVIRHKKTTTQTGKSRSERWESMRNIYAIASNFNCVDKRLLLVDDVITTGATMSGLIELLVGAGVKEIGVICLASEG